MNIQSISSNFNSAFTARKKVKANKEPKIHYMYYGDGMPIPIIVLEKDELPQDFTCPLCKAPRSEFVEIVDEPAPPTEPKTNNPEPSKGNGKKYRWKCKICGYVYEGYELPQDFTCPRCKKTKGGL